MSNNANGATEVDQDEFRFSSDMTLEDVRSSHRQFCHDRGWGKHHAPRNILLAMVAEVGELSEIFQWKGEVEKGLPEFSPSEKEHVGEELSDVLIYLIDLAAQCHVDLPAAVFNKLQKNIAKYPADKVFGKSKKYNSYVTTDLTNSNNSNTPMSATAVGGAAASAVVDILPDREREEGDGSE